MKASLNVMPEVIMGPFGIFPIRHWPSANSQLHLPPFLDEVTFSELSSPTVGKVSVQNLSSVPCFIPSGWIVEGLNQTRMLTAGMFLSPGAHVELDVVCIERGRWGSFRQGTDGGRAPLSVLLATGIASAGRQPVNSNFVQGQVWDVVSKHESSRGLRATNSLSQVMQEDFEADSYLASLRKEIDELVFEPRANGFVITMNGQILMAEWFANSNGVEGLLRKTLQGLAFDARSFHYRNSHPNDLAEVAKWLIDVGEIHLGTKAEELVINKREDAFIGRYHLKDGELCVSQIFNTNHEFMKESIYV